MQKKKKRVRAITERLSVKQLSFCVEYLRNGGNVKEAFVAAGYSGDPNKISYNVLRQPAVREYLDMNRAKMAEGFKITKEDMLLSLYKKTQYIDEILYLAGLSELTSEQYERLERLKEVIKVSDANKAWAQISKVMGWDVQEQIEVQRITQINYVAPDNV